MKMWHLKLVMEEKRGSQPIQLIEGLESYLYHEVDINESLDPKVINLC